MAIDYGSFEWPSEGGGSGVTSINALTGAVTLAAGSGISITPAGNTLTIAATGGGGTVTSVSVVSANGFAGSVATATTTPAITLSTTITASLLAGNGTAISAASLASGNIFVGSAGNLPVSVAMSGDATLANTGAITLATVNGNVGSFGSSTSIPSFTVNAKGLITAASGNVVIAPAGTLTGTTLASNVVTSSLTSLGVQSVALNMGTHLINNVVNPVSAQDAATKAYVDNVAAGINPAVAVQAATTAAADTSGFTYNNGVSGIGATLTSNSNNTALTVDGFTFTVLGQRLLVKNDTQSPSGAFNGVYTVTQLQAALLPVILTRALDYDQPSDINNTGAIPVINGTVNGTTQWVQTALVNTVGTDPLSFVLFSRNPANYLLAANNLSDVANAVTSFNNLGNSSAGAYVVAGNLALTKSSTSVLTINSTAFIFDSTNQALGIGVQPSTNAFIDGINSSGAAKRLVLTGYGTGSTVGFRGRFGRGTSGTPAAAQNGDILNFISGQGYGTSQFPAASTGSLNFVAGETFTNTSNATYFTVQVTPTTSVTAAEALRVNSTGNVLIGTTTDSGTQKLQVNGNSNVGTVTAGVWNGTATNGFQFITSGTTYTTPANVTTATVFKFTLIGGGAGGGGCPATANVKGGGGGAGGTAIVYLTGLTASTGYTIAIGAAGTGASNATGGAGGNTTLTVSATTYTASGGAGGTPVNSAPGGAGGTTTNATIAITGQAGTGTGIAGGNSNPGSSGGSSMYGYGGTGGVGTAAGNAGTGFGAGGGGANAGGSATAAAGGNGTQGAIIVEWSN